MTSLEMKDAFLLEFDSITNFSAPGYLDNEINYYLNKGQRNFFLYGYNPDVNRTREGYEETEQRSKEFSELKRFSTITGADLTSPGNHPNSYFANLPEGLWLVTNEESEITYTDDCNDVITKRNSVKPVSDDYYNANIYNPDKKPFDGLTWRIDFSKQDTTVPLSPTNKKRHELITFDGATINNYYITYVKYPRDVDVTDNTGSSDSEFDPATHMRIVELAVELALEAVQQPRFQTKKAENASVE